MLQASWAQMVAVVVVAMLHCRRLAPRLLAAAVVVVVLLLPGRITVIKGLAAPAAAAAAARPDALDTMQQSMMPWPWAVATVVMVVVVVGEAAGGMCEVYSHAVLSMRHCIKRSRWCFQFRHLLHLGSSRLVASVLLVDRVGVAAAVQVACRGAIFFIQSVDLRNIPCT